MKFFRELYDSRYNYVKKCFSVIRYLNELILKGGVKRVSLLLAILIDSDNILFFFFNVYKCISRVGLKESGGYS